MVPISLLKTGRLSEAKPGALFLPREVTHERFLVGAANDIPVAIALDGQPFTFDDLPKFNGRRGFVVSRTAFVVDPKSATPFRNDEGKDLPLGSLILSGDNVSIYAVSKGSRHPIVLKGSTINDSDGVAFTQWSIIVKTSAGASEELFRFVADGASATD